VELSWTSGNFLISSLSQGDRNPAWFGSGYVAYPFDI
jgi:hypothetical protein